MKSLREQAEERLKNGYFYTTPVDINHAKQLIHELQVHQIELELQNEELKRIQQELQKTQTLYYELYNFAPVGYVSLTTELSIENINQTGAELLAGEKSEPKQFLDHSFAEYVHPNSQDALYFFCQKLQKVPGKHSTVLQIKNPNTQPLYIEMEGVPRAVEEGRLTLFCTFLNITDRLRMEEELKHSLQIKELLLRELNHRVKNNLQMISSLIFLQKETLECQEAREALEKIQSRIKCISIIYEMLQKSDQVGKINLKLYSRSLTERLLENFIDTPSRIEVLYDLDEFWIDTDRIVSLGQVLNEILLNALKHAFPGNTKGTLTLKLKDLKNGNLLIQIQDSGPGIPDSALKGISGTLGFQIMQGLITKLNGTLEIKNQQGALYSLQIPIK